MKDEIEHGLYAIAGRRLRLLRRGVILQRSLRGLENQGRHVLLEVSSDARSSAKVWGKAPR